MSISLNIHNYHKKCQVIIPVKFKGWCLAWVWETGWILEVLMYWLETQRDENVIKDETRRKQPEHMRRKWRKMEQKENEFNLQRPQQTLKAPPDIKGWITLETIILLIQWNSDKMHFLGRVLKVPKKLKWLFLNGPSCNY